MKVVTIDFETAGIEKRPHYPPKPAGVAIKLPGRKAKYYAWGHPTGNNCTREEAERHLRDALSKYPVLCHNIKFDADVAETHFGIVWPWERSHDTMILAFLEDPHSKQLGLKPLAQRFLNLAPEEQEAVRDWLYENGVVRKGTKDWGAKICEAPGDLVGAYAIGDVERTAALFEYFYERVKNRGMLASYQREIALLPILLANEREGMQVDLPLLEEDTQLYGEVLEKLDNWIREYLEAPTLNIDSDQQFADALEAKKLVSNWILTEKGQRSTSKESLRETLQDKLLLGVLEYRSLLANFHGTFMSPWLNTALETNGVLHTNWNSTAQEKGGGTRTGRLSSNPNFQNIPSNDKLDDAEKSIEAKGVYKKLKWLRKLPHLRQYIVADDETQVLCDRDFNGQELRVAAHFEDAEMLAAYTADPRIDLHQYGSDKIKEYVGLDLPRKKVKIIVFTILYGGGLATIAERLDTTVENAKKLRDAYFKVFPGIQELGREMQRRSKSNLSMRTWGGREYFSEPPKVINGRLREFGYKLTNYLIQGSSADITKEATIRYYNARKDSRLVLTVHDEIVISAPKRNWKQEMSILRDCMNSIELDVPLLSEGEVGYRWYDMEEAE